MSHTEHRKLPEDKKYYILGYMDGIIDFSTDDFDQKQKKKQTAYPNIRKGKL